MSRSAIAVLICALSLPAHAMADNTARHSISIPAGDLGLALQQLTRQSGTDLVYRPEQVRGQRTQGAAGRLSAQEAVTRLLAGTHLTVSADATGALLISAGVTSDAVSQASATPVPPPTGDSLRLAQATSGPPAGDAAVSVPVMHDTSLKDSSGQLQEIIVTAQKREERLQDVPIPVSVITGIALTQSNQVKIADYYNQVPGLSIAPSTMSTQTLSIRGITTGAVATGPPNPAPTVGIMIDDVPFGGSGGGDTLVPDLDPGDLARIEVLRGPQGTLYGSSSMGGLIKFVTVDPSTDAVSGRVEAGADGVQNAGQLGYTFRGSVNVPVNADFAVRASVFTRRDPGYIDNPVLGIEGVNEDRATGGHISALWRPSDNLSVKLSALYQSVTGNGTNDVTPNPAAITGVGALGDLQQYYIRGSGGYERKTQAYSAVVNYQTGNVTLTSLTGYNAYHVRDSFDLTSAFGSLSQSQFGQIGTPLLDHISFDRFTQELRLTGPLGPKFDYLLGGFYSRTSDYYQWPLLATNPSTGAVAGNWGTINAYDAPIIYSDYAAFGDLTFHITDRLDLQLGARESEYVIVGKPWTYTGPFSTVIFGFPSENYVAFQEYTVRQNAFTYLATPRFTITPDLMVYARLASGFRPGGANAGTPGVPLVFSPDKTKEYELGVKGDFLDRRISVDASIYYIDWKNIQLPLLTADQISFTGNGGSAKSQGVELSLEARPVGGLKLGGWVAFDDAQLTETVPSISGYPGDKLPNTPRFSASVSAADEFPLVQNITGMVGLDLSYVGAREDIFSIESPERQYLPPYAKTDLRAGVKADAWTVTLYANNVTNKRGLISGGVGNEIPYSFYYIQPRTIGLSATRTF